MGACSHKSVEKITNPRYENSSPTDVVWIGLAVEEVVGDDQAVGEHFIGAGVEIGSQRGSVE